MPNPDIAAWWGAVLSTILLILKAVDQFGRRARQLVVSACAEPPFQGVSIDVENVGPRPVTLRSAMLVYGDSGSGNAQVATVVLTEAHRLGDNDVWTAFVEREELVTEVATRRVKQDYYRRLWVVVTTTGGYRIARTVRVSPSIIQGEYPRGAEASIAADALIGFPRLPDQVTRPPVGVFK